MTKFFSVVSKTFRSMTRKILKKIQHWRQQTCCYVTTGSSGQWIRSKLNGSTTHLATSCGSRRNTPPFPSKGWRAPLGPTSRTKVGYWGHSPVGILEQSFVWNEFRLHWWKAALEKRRRRRDSDCVATCMP